MRKGGKEGEGDVLLQVLPPDYLQKARVVNSMGILQHFICPMPECIPADPKDVIQYSNRSKFHVHMDSHRFMISPEFRKFLTCPYCDQLLRTVES